MSTDKPWESEPDFAEWELRGFRCFALRHPETKHLCGYIEVPEGHPWYGKTRRDFDVDVHGGITWASAAADLDSTGTPGTWVIGFDCSHAGDLAPGVIEDLERLELEGVRLRSAEVLKRAPYRDLEYVKGECDLLAEQAAGAR